MSQSTRRAEASPSLPRRHAQLRWRSARRAAPARHPPGRVETDEDEVAALAACNDSRALRGPVAEARERDVAVHAGPVGQRHLDHRPVRREGHNLALTSLPMGRWRRR